MFRTCHETNTKADTLHVDEVAHKSKVLRLQAIPLTTDELSRINMRSIYCDETLLGLTLHNDLKGALRETVAGHYFAKTTRRTMCSY